MTDINTLMATNDLLSEITPIGCVLLILVVVAAIIAGMEDNGDNNGY